MSERLTGKELIDDSAIDRTKELVRYLDQILARVNAISKSARETGSLTGLNNIVTKTKEYNVEVQKTVEETKAAIKAERDLVRARAQQESILSSSTTESRKQVLLTRELRKEKDLIIRATNNEFGAYKRLNAQLQLNVEKYKNLAASGKASKRELESLRKTIDKQRSSLKKIDEDLGNYSRTVGGYFQTLTRFTTSVLGAFGAVEAARFAISFSVEAAQLAREARGVEAAFEQLGEAGEQAFEDIRRATRGTLSDLELRRSIVDFKNLGIELETTGVAFEFLQLRSVQTGRAIASLREDLVTGLGRGSVKILDNLGISMAELNKLTKETGLSVQEAFGVIAQREIEKSGDLIDDNIDPAQRLTASMENLKLEVGRAITQFQGLEQASKFLDGLAIRQKVLNEAAEIGVGFYREIRNEILRTEFSGFDRVLATISTTDQGKELNALILERIALRRKEIEEVTNARRADEEGVQITDQVIEKEEERGATLANLKVQLEQLNAEKETLTLKDKERITSINQEIAALEKQIAAFDTSASSVREYRKEVERVNLEIEAFVDNVSNAFASTLSSEQTGVLEFVSPEEIITGLQTSLDRMEEINRAWRERDLEALKQYYELYGQEIEAAFNLEKELTQRNREAINNLTQEGLDALFEIRLNSLDRELEALSDQREQIQSNEALTQSERIGALEAIDQREQQLAAERKKRETQQLIFEKGIALAQIAINLSEEISAIRLAAAQLSIINPVVGAAYATSNTLKAIITAAAQTASVAAQIIPAFFKGKPLGDNYEGPAMVGEQRPEILITKDGRAIVIPKPTVMNVGRDDIIVPSFTEMDRSLRAPQSEVSRRLHDRIERDTQRMNEFSVEMFEKAMVRALKKSNINVTTQVVLPKQRRARW